MPKKLDLKDKTFGFLTVVSDSEERTPDGAIRWKCICVCGGETIVPSRRLVRGETKSCGCKRGELISKHHRGMDNISTDQWSSIKRGAGTRGISFDISREDAWQILKSQGYKCALTGRSIKLRPMGSRSLPNRGRSCTASLDRIDSSLPYTRSNVQWVHKDVNIAKNTLSNEDFIKMCQDVTRYDGGRKTICLSGGMDCLHVGHLRMILDAKRFGNVVIILNSDKWLLRKKGYIFMPWHERREILLNIAAVHDVIPVEDDDDTVCSALSALKPDYFGNGGDRKTDNTPEIDICNELGIKLVWNLGGEKAQSSSELVGRAMEQLNDR